MDQNESTNFLSSIHILWHPFLFPSIFLLLSVHFITTWFKLSRIPGPFLASLSNFPRVLWVRTKKAHEIHIALHRKYGKLVRLGPNMVSVSDPAEIQNIYGFRGEFKKSNLYSVFRPYSRGKVLTGMVALQDEQYHRMLRKPFASIYSSRGLLPSEPLVDSAVETLIQQFHRMEGSECDFGFWMQLYVFDVLCQITFSERLGFLDQGKDVGGMLRLVWNQFRDGAPVSIELYFFFISEELRFRELELNVNEISQMPWSDWIWRKNPILLRVMPNFRMTPIVPFAIGHIKSREKAKQNPEKKVTHQDILTRFIEAREQDPSILEWALLTWTLGGIGAGGDTSVNVIRALFHNLLKYPLTLKKVRNEIGMMIAQKNGAQLGWQEMRSLPYLDACIKEAARIHPSIGHPLERIIPAGGSTICGEFFKEGTIVGINAWVVNRDQDVFGEDVNSWRPERWICDEAQRLKMEQTLFSFGAGHRVCPGKNLFDMMVSKLVLAILENFELELVDPEVPLVVENCWLVKQTGLKMKLKAK